MSDSPALICSTCKEQKAAIADMPTLQQGLV